MNKLLAEINRLITERRTLFIVTSILILSLTMTYLLFQSDWYLRLVYPLKYEQVIMEKAFKYEYDPYLVSAIIYVESKFNYLAVSGKGARGLMQIMPETGEWIAGQLGVEFQEEFLVDPVFNIEFGIWYLANLRKEFNGDKIKVLAAYNAGRGNVRNWLESDRWDGELASISNIPFIETRNFIRQVLRVYKRYQQLYNFE